jgi:mediator of RNA polymerase II transcription subunit 17
MHTTASPEFQANSWAALSREDDGSVNLKMPRLIGEPKQLVVSMEKDGKVLGRSSLAQPLPSDAPLELRVREARNTILDQELWHEMNREARSLLAYNVQLLPASVRYQIDDSTAIIFTLATLGEVPDLGGEPELHSGDGYTETIRAALHLLLAYAHRQNARKRTQIRPLTTDRGRQAKPAYSLLKPIIAYTQHETWLRSSITFVSDLTATLRLAGIDAARFNLEEQPLPQVSPQGASEQLLSALLLQPFVFRIDLSLTPQARMTILGITRTGARGPSSVIRFMPPSPKQDAQALAQGYGPNLLGAIYQPADLYESLRDAFQYLQGAATRALAKHFEILAANWMANAPPAESTPTVWAATIRGDAVRDVETERRGVGFELLGADEGGGPTGGQSAAGPSPPKVTGLELVADQADVQGGIVHQTWSWTLDDVKQGHAEPAERIEDVVQRVLMTAA